ncbi:unnamed protein product [Thlaspi arvense]|uniref:DUF676 domain-containing protein n=1 Tax=Thlaspi arvense TaxID=13288 RepID=A0AAU9RCE7_THLAR|nr:unnamed protein product [Thlaspi arvense]
MAESDESGNVDLTIDFPGERAEPTHLVVMVNGLIGSAQNWRFAAKQLLKKYPQDLVVHCSKRNHSTQTFDGVDVMGERLAEEVRSVIKRHPSLQKISFVAHSLGGLIARYAVARLYEQESRQELPQNSDDKRSIEEPKGRIAGLEPVFFITSATPHLGSRGHKQVPLFSGSHTLERLATRMSWCLGKTGKHLFLADGDDGKPPLLLRMTICNDIISSAFVNSSALRCFKRRIAYANTSFDHLVGWSTSSIRRRNELPKLQRGPVNEKYPHIVNVETPDTSSNEEEDRPGINSDGVDMEEEMIRELTKMRWERVDVSFRGTLQRFLAHNTIQASVKTKMINSAGADVIQHMVDNFEP